VASFELVFGDATRVPLAGRLTVGRSPDATVVLHDPAVSRLHARIWGDGREPLIEDAGSSHGTFVDGVRVTRPTRLHDGARIQLGDSELIVERRRDPAEAGRTIVVPATAAAEPPSAGPRVRPGYALKRLEAAEGARRWVLRDLENGTFRRLGDVDAALFEQLDGSRPLAELIVDAERRFGASGPARLATLLADLSDRGLLVGTDAAPSVAAANRGSRLLRPRVKLFPGAGDAIDAVYRRGGRLLLTPPAVAVIALLAVVGAGVFAYLVASRYGTPFVVASKLGLGGLVFLLGRFAVVAVHEIAHGLVMTSFGRHVEQAGLKLLLIFPYAFVDTSQAWFEPRRRRIAISAAGPASDLTLGAVFSLCCLRLAPSAPRDVFFQLAFGAYLGACFNLNPFLDRDGYHILVDLLREPNLRRRAREQLARRLSGGAREGDSRLLARYSLLGIAWSVVAAGFVVATTLRYRATFDALVPAAWIVWAGLGAVWAAALSPVAIVLAVPLRRRRAGA
jgi:putative peptide zinc metalloprotease protein